MSSNDSHGRYDRFVSEMKVHKTLEEAVASWEAHKEYMRLERERRRARLAEKVQKETNSDS